MRFLHTIPVAVLLASVLVGQVRVVAGGSAVSAASLRSVRELGRAGLDRLVKHFPGTPTRPVEIVVHASAKSVGADLLDSLHPGVPGFARLQRDQIHLILSEIKVDPPNDLRTTIDHELVHILLDQFVGANGPFVPRWFHEGLAQDLAGAIYLGVQEEDLVYRAKTRTHLRFRTLVDGFPTADKHDLALAYGQSFSFVAYLRRELGLPLLLNVARACGPKRGFPAAFAHRRNESLVSYEDKWLNYILHESGAGWRFILRNCFLISVVALILPLLALAMARRRNREESIKRMMDAEVEQPFASEEFVDVDAEFEEEPEDGWEAECGDGEQNRREFDAEEEE